MQKSFASVPAMALALAISVWLPACSVPPPLPWPQSPLYETPANDPNWVPPASRDEAMAAMAGHYAHYDIVAYDGETANGPLATFIVSYGYTDLVIENGQLVAYDRFCSAAYIANQPFETIFSDAATQAIKPPGAICQIQYAEPAPLRTHVPWIDRDLQAIVLQALAKRREDRYQGVSELRADLDRYLQGDSVQARRGGRIYAFAKFIRRHKILAGSAAVLAIVSIAYAISMTVLYQRAVVAEGKAEVSADEARRQFVAAHESLEFVISQIETKLDRVAGTRELRKELLADCYDKLRGLDQWHTNDPRIRTQLAAVHRRLGSIAMDLDRHEEAASELERSYQILDQLVKEHPDDPSLWEQLSIAHVLLGDVAKRREQWDVARRRYDQALQIDLRLAREHPENDRFIDNLSWSYERFSGQQLCPDTTARDDYRRKRHELAQKLFDRNPSSPVRMNNLCISHLMQAKALGDSDRSAFVDHVQAAFDLANRLVAAEPLNGQFAFTLAMTLTARLDEPLRVGDVETARLTLKRLIAVCYDLDKRDTDSHWARAARARLEGAHQALQKLHSAQINTNEDLRWVLPKYDGL